MRKLESVKRKSNKKLSVRISSEEAAAEQFLEADGTPIDGQELLLRHLLPSAVKAFFAELEEEVRQVCGLRYSHGDGAVRWGSEGGSVYLGGQKVAIRRPRVRNGDGEQRLATYERFRTPKAFEERVFREGLRQVSQRNYERGVEQIGGAFGFKKATVSRAWKNATKRQFEELMTRRLNGLGIVAVFIDGKRFRTQGVVLALGVAENGRKHVLGFYEANTESGANCLELLNDLERRGLPKDRLLFIVDGGSGLNAALEAKYAVQDAKKRAAIRVRCHVHKWSNLVEALGRDNPATKEASVHFWNMRNAADMVEARAHAQSLEAVLHKANLSALASFREAKDDLLAIHELRLTAQLKRFFSTTNPCESLNSLLEEDLRRCKRWRDSSHFQRWLATATLHNERKMRRVRGASGLPALAARLRVLCVAKEVDSMKKAA